MATGAAIEPDRGRTRSVAAARAEAAEAVSMLAEAERLRAEAAAKLIDFDLLDGHITEGYTTPQRHLIHQAKLTIRDANRIHRVTRFAATHTLIADALEAGDITIEHADILRTAAATVGAELFDDHALDLLADAGLAGGDDAGEDAHRRDHRADIDADVRHRRRDAGEPLVVDDGPNSRCPTISSASRRASSRPRISSTISARPSNGSDRLDQRERCR